MYSAAFLLFLHYYDLFQKGKGYVFVLTSQLTAHVTLRKLRLLTTWNDGLQCCQYVSRFKTARISCMCDYSVQLQGVMGESASSCSRAGSLELWLREPEESGCWGECGGGSGGKFSSRTRWKILQSLKRGGVGSSSTGEKIQAHACVCFIKYW